AEQGSGVLDGEADFVGAEAERHGSYDAIQHGDLEHRLDVRGIVQELYDVAVLDGIARPMALGFRSEEIRFTIKHT
ncbi:MAG: hypothetical protein AAGF49_10565, partial [Pseudomonadota bacterium]